MTLQDLSEYQAEWVTPMSTTYRGWTVYALPPNTQGIAVLEMLQLMERYPTAEYGFHSAHSLHTLIEAKKLAYADLLRYIGDPHFANIPVTQILDRRLAANRARQIGEKARCSVEPSVLRGIIDMKGKDTIYLTAVDKGGNIASLIQSNYSVLGSGVVPDRTGFVLQNRGGMFTLENGQVNSLAGHKRPLHTPIPAFMEKSDVKIGFGTMGGWNQAQAQAQFVSGIADYGMSIQQALEASRFTKLSFNGCGVKMEESISENARLELMKMGHKIEVIPGRTPYFGYGQAVFTNEHGVHFGASDPRHDGAAIPEPAAVFDRSEPLFDNGVR
jgi:gamma-glutamyltranspeptidase/glutathione hydrolase